MNLKKELSTCNTNRWQRKAKLPVPVYLILITAEYFHLVRLEHHKEDITSPGQEEKTWEEHPTT